MEQKDELPSSDIIYFAIVFALAALMLALGAVSNSARQSTTFDQAKKKVTQISFWADYLIVLIAVFLPASWVASIAILQEGGSVVIASIVSFFTTGLAMKRHAKQTVMGTSPSPPQAMAS